MFSLHFLLLKIYSQWLHLKVCSYIVGTRGNNGAVVVLVDGDYSSKEEFDEHAAVIESVTVQTVIETGLLIA